MEDTAKEKQLQSKIASGEGERFYGRCVTNATKELNKNKYQGLQESVDTGWFHFFLHK